MKTFSLKSIGFQRKRRGGRQEEGGKREREIPLTEGTVKFCTHLGDQRPDSKAKTWG